jgi:hypothetical protein
LAPKLAAGWARGKTTIALEHARLVLGAEPRTLILNQTFNTGRNRAEQRQGNVRGVVFH